MILWEAVPFEAKFLKHGAAGLVGLNGSKEGVKLDCVIRVHWEAIDVAADASEDVVRGDRWVVAFVGVAPGGFIVCFIGVIKLGVV